MDFRISTSQKRKLQVFFFIIFNVSAFVMFNRCLFLLWRFFPSIWTTRRRFHTKTYTFQVSWQYEPFIWMVRCRRNLHCVWAKTTGEKFTRTSVQLTEMTRGLLMAIKKVVCTKSSIQRKTGLTSSGCILTAGALGHVPWDKFHETSPMGQIGGIMGHWTRAKYSGDETFFRVEFSPDFLEFSGFRIFFWSNFWL